ncbi:MAG: hypothetical protein DMG57_38635 [Acidobacteria bacterium]|nr:MAG: hypothetical protein DMG57_38635 [Acidobacteriota bacterium]
MVTNVHTQLNNCGGYMMKTIQPKTVVSLQATGDYSLEIHDITADIAATNFAYRVLIRPQIPHIGKVELEQERINLMSSRSCANSILCPPICPALAMHALRSLQWRDMSWLATRGLVRRGSVRGASRR